MDAFDRWIYLDGPEPEALHAMLDLLRDPTPPTAEDRALMARAFFQQLDAARPGAREQPQAEAPAPPNPVPPDPPRPRPLTLAQPDPEDAAPATGAELPPAPPDPPAAPPPTLAPSTLAATALLVDAPAPVGHPFTSAAPAPRAQRPHPTLQSITKPTGLGDTTPVDDDSISRAVAALPFAGSPGGNALVHFPNLTLKQYVSLRLDLTRCQGQPDMKADLLAKYRVPSELALSALHRHWQQQIDGNPAVRAEFDADVKQYIDWLVKQMAPA